MEEPRWTLDELAERVGAALAVDYDGQPSGRVRDVPDRRAIRWYTTIGLVDRPLAHRGRTALYGHRHLLQVVAVKRLQARGLPLVAIQRELAGATDARLAQVARLPATSQPQVVPAAAGPVAARAAPVASAPVGARSGRAAFWREPPSTTTGPPEGDGVATLRGVRLGAGATLLLEPGRELGPGDLGAVLEAARPLLDVLRARGLAGPPAGPAPRPGPEPRREHP